MPEHRDCDVKVGDDSVPEGTYRNDTRRGSAHHLLGVVSDGQDLLAIVIDGYDRGFLKHYPLAPYEDKRISGAQIDAHIPRPAAEERSKGHDGWLPSETGFVTAVSLQSQHSCCCDEPSKPFSRRLTYTLSPMIMWSSTSIPSIDPARTRRLVIDRSSGLGLGSPLGWL